jgi:hypothetical protein
MKTIQYFLIISCLIPFLILKQGSRAIGRASYRVGFILFVASFVTAVLTPNLVMVIANRLGVGRGTDLLVYLTTFALICLSLIMIVKFERTQRDITLLVRIIALQSVKKSETKE